MPLKHRRPAESASIVGISPATGRPLFVPPGIRQVRTGPTTRAELDRLLADVDAPAEVSGIRSRVQQTPVASRGFWLRVLAVLGLAP